MKTYNDGGLREVYSRAYDSAAELSRLAVNRDYGPIDYVKKDGDYSMNAKSSYGHLRYNKGLEYKESSSESDLIDLLSL